MLIKHPDNIAPSEITSRDLYESRREFMLKALGGAALVGAGALGFATTGRQAIAGMKLPGVKKSPLSVAEILTPLKDVVKRPFITVGFSAFVLMLPLAVTSTNAMILACLLAVRVWFFWRKASSPIANRVTSQAT